ncbi:MAG: CRISPR-associated endonuclease Cas2 [Firmicutes bacterium]|nr:CRISPR-associated endonuclease Cas2 [Bacillota bacterium]
MLTLVIYDIESDRTRYKIAEACKDYGLQRIQYSAFVGKQSNNRREELTYRLRHTLGKQAGYILVYAICQRDQKLIREIGSKDYGSSASYRH